MGRLNLALGLALAASACVALGAKVATAKGIAPQNASCDQHASSSPAWRDCVGAANASRTDDELFYAGYWLAKNGRYKDALRFLTHTRTKDERVLTYIGYATRKSGDIESALGFYKKALALNPDFTIARAYLGEAHVSLGHLDKARDELREIADRCGTSCAEYKELEDAITHSAI